MALSSRVKKIFNKAWRRYGKPVATVVRPVDEWSLPGGYAYEPHYDRIMDSSGNVLTGPEAYWVSDQIYIVPNKYSGDLKLMIAAGAVPAGTTEFGILTTDLTTIEQAHAVQIDGDWFDVIDTGHAPIGTTGTWALIRVARRS